jgi:hypothetical protein
VKLTTRFHLVPRLGMRGATPPPSSVSSWRSVRVQDTSLWRGIYEGESKSFRTENNNNKHTLRSNTKGYGGRTHRTDSQNSDTTAPSGRDIYYMQFSLQAASPETVGYTLIFEHRSKFICTLPLFSHFLFAWIQSWDADV